MLSVEEDMAGVCVERRPGRRTAGRASAVGDRRGDPAVLLVRLHQALEGGFGFFATEGLF